MKKLSVLEMNSLIFAIRCNFPHFCGEERAVEAADMAESMKREILAYRDMESKGKSDDLTQTMDCEFCNTTDSPRHWNHGGPHEFRVREGALLCYDEQLGWEGVAINYCPMCGRKLKEG